MDVGCPNWADEYDWMRAAPFFPPALKKRQVLVGDKLGPNGKDGGRFLTIDFEVALVTRPNVFIGVVCGKTASGWPRAMPINTLLDSPSCSGTVVADIALAMDLLPPGPAHFDNASVT